MINSIDAIQQQNIFRVQPVKWNEPSKQEQQSGAIANYGTNFGKYTPYHPNMQSSTTANKLDLLG